MFLVCFFCFLLFFMFFFVLYFLFCFFIFFYNLFFLFLQIAWSADKKYLQSSVFNWNQNQPRRILKAAGDSWLVHHDPDSTRRRYTVEGNNEYTGKRNPSATAAAGWWRSVISRGKSASTKWLKCMRTQPLHPRKDCK